MLEFVFFHSARQINDVSPECHLLKRQHGWRRPFDVARCMKNRLLPPQSRGKAGMGVSSQEASPPSQPSPVAGKGVDFQYSARHRKAVASHVTA